MNNSTYDELLDHSYDGVQEFDNPTPGWWNWLFGLSVVFSIGYFIFFHLGQYGWTVQDAHRAAVTADAVRQYGRIGDLTPDEPTILKYMQDPVWLAVGEGIFRSNCVQCHGQNGEGNIGPNMTDDYYKNIKKLSDFGDVIANGAANGAMPAWRNRLGHKNDIVMAACYMASLRGKNLPGPRGLEGEIIPPWPKPPTSAPVKAN